MLLTDEIETITGVGPKSTESLAKLGLHQVVDLLFHLPYKYQDRTRITPICSARSDEHCLVSGNILSVNSVQKGRRRLICTIGDNTGSIDLVFFHFNANQLNSFVEGKQLSAFGEVRFYGKSLCMVHPEYRFVNNEVEVEEYLTPVYPVMQGLSQKLIRKIVQKPLALIQLAEVLPELIPGSIIDKLNLHCSLKEALNFLHNPPSSTSVDSLNERTHPYQKRLAFEELLAHTLGLKKNPG